MKRAPKRDAMTPGSFWTYTPVPGRRGRLMSVNGDRVVIEDADGRRIDLLVRTFLREWDPDDIATRLA